MCGANKLLILSSCQKSKSPKVQNIFCRHCKLQFLCANELICFKLLISRLDTWVSLTHGCGLPCSGLVVETELSWNRKEKRERMSQSREGSQGQGWVIKTRSVILLRPHNLTQTNLISTFCWHAIFGRIFRIENHRISSPESAKRKGM